ncbi:tellurium resistance protein [Bacillus pseudomycoides]|uniref:TerD family protein n=1 Tax=Bacillus pseudomycoides TaxID=64104 RepID=UPI000BEB68D2|nr:TerD family protein [Bacillus pseudomycoides]PED71328.1 tellurium resistance protein [Bacillus pseudomycoides]PEI40581.1 tellurium resistance protein [Bacillus pseudomycoides]PEJ79995.1 tellurium resistance protein [Bacillus pseudomycoides]PEM13184.1 tellurium resistance protein [Bacillus pseudomycoides]PEO98739.1 tellurium resistance protein [Bacillus pseudomycoides]
MTHTLVKGQKTDVTKAHPGVGSLLVGLNWNAKVNMEVDASAFLVGMNGKITGEEDFVFYGQPYSSCRSIILNQEISGEDKQNFCLDLTRIKNEVQKIVFSITIHHAEEKKHFFRDVTGIQLRIRNAQTKSELANFPITFSFTDESAVIVGELYRHAGEWKFNPIGAGYFGGLAALCENFGIEVDDDEKQVPPPVEKETLATPMPTQIPMKVELKKKQSVNIQKSKMVTATLEWETNKDLDLYCFYVTKAGEMGKIYYRNLGSSNMSPYIALDGDAQEPGKETVRIYRPEALKYVLFAAYSALSNGVGSFYSMKAKAVVDNHMGNVVTAPLLEINDNAYWVCIAHIDFTNQNEMKISHVESYSRDHSEASPLLYEDGQFRMDVGRIEFKNEDDYEIINSNS